jgi:oligopeptide transport system ATP-binding protein
MCRRTGRHAFWLASDVLEPLVDIVGVSKTFRLRRGFVGALTRHPAQGLRALDDVSLSVTAGQTVGIVGESGSGKSTLARVLVRLVDADSGSVRFRGQDVREAAPVELRALRRHMQLVYQDPYSSLNPRMQVGRAIVEPARVHHVIDRGQERAYASELLHRVGLPASVASRYPRSLSGGQRQRVAIARALSAKPELIIADESVSALDVSIQAQILNLFMELQRDLGLSMIVISHQLAVVAQVADHVAVMYLGRIVEIGPTAAVFENPAHPYTAALLAAEPGRHRRKTVTGVAAGEARSQELLTVGCPYQPRCPYAIARCAVQAPPVVALTAEHRSWCDVFPYAGRHTLSPSHQHDVNAGATPQDQ